jgi:phage-related minor tail protein
MQIVPGTTQTVCDAAEAAANGDQHAALAMLLGAYLEMASRVVTSEQASNKWLLAMSAYCDVGSARLANAAKFYASGHRATDDEQRNFLGRLANVAQEGASFAELLQRQFDALEIELDRDDDLAPL